MWSSCNDHDSEGVLVIGDALWVGVDVIGVIGENVHLYMEYHQLQIDATQV